MSRKSYWFILISLLLTLALAACGGQSITGETDVTPSPGSNNNSGNDGLITVPPTESSDTANLPRLPGLSPSGGGLGGGGDAAMGEGQPVDGYGGDGMDIMPIFWENRLENAQFNLNTTLPASVSSAAAWQQNYAEMPMQNMRDLASQFGFTGPIYTDPWYDAFIQENPGIWPGPRSYYLFDGSRMLSFYGANVSYFDNRAMDSTPGWDLMPLAQARPIAEAYLNQRGLLNFPYEVVPSLYGGQEVSFYRLIDGVRNNIAEISVSVTQQGNILSIYIQPFSEFSALGNYPLITAEEAWQLAQGKPDYLRVFHSVYTDPATMPIYDDPMAGQYRYWSRSYQNGETSTLYFYPTVYIPADGSSTPLVRMGDMRIEGSAADLQLLVDNTNRYIRLTGTVQGDIPNQSITVTSIEILGDYGDWQYREGTIRRADGQVYLDSIEGETILIPGAPVDLPDGERVYVSGPTITPGEPFPTFVWNGIDRIVTQTSEPEMFDPGMYPTPSPISQVNIDKVELIYTYSYLPSVDGSDSGATYLQPAWRFTGTTDTGELVEIIVQAVSPEFLQPAG